MLQFKRPWSDGTSGVVLSPSELLQRLAALVPPPGIHTVLYHGVLSTKAEWRSQVVPEPRGRRCRGSLGSGLDERRGDAHHPRLPAELRAACRCFGVEP